MPGPSNPKKKRGKKHKGKKSRGVKAQSQQRSPTFAPSSSSSSPTGDHPPHDAAATPPCSTPPIQQESPRKPLPEPPRVRVPEGTPYIYIHDPGSGPRVRDTRAFLSSYFAHPPSLEEPLCAEFAQEEVLQMLMTLLPEETALILWYNKSRAKGRICPACQRLYRLGDTLPEHLADGDEKRAPKRPPSPQLQREQRISGLCSPMCFILASFANPSALRETWGRTSDEISDEAWEALGSPGTKCARNGDHLGLGLLLTMTRLPDLGLGQLCMPEVDFDDEEEVRGEEEGKGQGSLVAGLRVV